MCWLTVTVASGQESKYAQMDFLTKQVLLPIEEEFVNATELGIDADRVEFPNRLGHNLSGWFIRSENATKTILICPGNAGNVSIYFPYAGVFIQHGFNVLIFNYQGFGESDGIPTIMSLTGDIDSAYEFLVHEKQVNPDDLGVFGISLGAPLSLYLAARQPVAALAVEDMFIPNDMVAEFVERTKPGPIVQAALKVVSDGLLPSVDPIRNVQKVECPILFMHGAQDDFLRPVASFKVAAAATAPSRTWIMSGVGHAPESLEVNDREYAHQLRRFFTDVLIRGQDLSQDPQFTFETSSLDEESENDKKRRYSTRVSTSIDGSAAIEVCLMNKNNQVVVERYLCDGSAEYEITTRFHPDFAAVVECQHYQKVANTWVPDLSPLSRDRAKFGEISTAAFRAFVDASQAKQKQGLTFTQMDRWQTLEPLLPEAAQIHPHIRPRFASLIAGYLVRMSQVPDDEMLPLWETMVSFLPEDPAKYYLLGDAYFQLGYRDRNVAQTLRRWIVVELQQANFEKAHDLIRVYIAIAQPAAATLEGIDVSEIVTPEDFEAALDLTEKR